MVETISITLRGRSDLPFELPVAELPIFSDNVSEFRNFVLLLIITQVIPSMLLHWGIIEIPESSSHFDETAKRAFKHDEEEYKAIIDGLEQEQQRDLGAVIPGPSLSSSQAALLRSAAVEAVRRMATRSPHSEVEFDAYVWSVSKQDHYRRLVRFSEQNTVYY